MLTLRARQGFISTDGNRIAPPHPTPDLTILTSYDSPCAISAVRACVPDRRGSRAYPEQTRLCDYTGRPHAGSASGYART